MEKKVKIYTTPGCHYCQQAKEYLTGRGVAFEALDVSQDREALKEMRSITGGGRSVPVIAICDQVILGFDQEAIEKALNCLQ
ncbi:MAG: NrdH-redoxin [Deltaproteobacteria bacterium]|nr:NrdH-redoxin [Deltaproteobacteria bacterium]